ncbi:PPE domain-containing protein [Tsukamurella asaccharolytica]|uniref:PPE domain-containing protein n=1 Tax=Tsukamurella asaccharolytica TaxID=2592067 RepID=A0A5C5R8Y9_9ACTN|nr:PPE domain-containing protein [Tsukamurella asaccharolytica]TWS19156.1 PPE domain-containing protein [Tsukamurella asaccharolytica]
MLRDPGFTGVDWSTRTTERLAGDLLGGAGAQPLSTAAQETARLASAYGAAAVQLDRLVVRLDGAVDLGREESGVRRTGPLPEYARWLARHAADLAEYATKVAGQAAAYETAARAMPTVADAARIRTDRENAQAAAAAGGAEPAVAALAGAAADSERVEQQAHGTAAAVMTGFERASEPLRAPWEFAAPPKLPDARTRTTKDKRSGSGSGAGRGGGGVGGAGGAAGVGVPAAPLGVFPASAVQRDHDGAGKPAPPASTSASSAGRGVPMMPAGMLGAAGAAAAARHAVQPTGAVPSEPDDEPDAFVVHAAPAVLGAHGESLAEQA